MQVPAEHSVEKFLARLGAVQMENRLVQPFEPRLVSDPASPPELRVVVAARPLHERCPRGFIEVWARSSGSLAGLQPTDSFVWAEGQEHHGVTSGNDALPPTEQGPGQNPCLARYEHVAHECHSLTRWTLGDVGRVGRHPEVVVSVGVRHGPPVSQGPSKSRRAAAAGTRHVKSATPHVHILARNLDRCGWPDRSSPWSLLLPARTASSRAGPKAPATLQHGCARRLDVNRAI